MEPVLPNLAALLGATPRAEAPPLRAQALSLPAHLLQAAAPVSLPGVVAESGVAGQLRITTPIGDVHVRAPTEFAVGRTITIVTRPASPGEVFLVSTPAPATPSAPGATTPPAPSGPAPATPGLQPTGMTGAGQTASAAGRPAQSGTVVAANNTVIAPAPSSLPSAPTLDPSSLLAAMEAPVLPEPAGRTPYPPSLQLGAPSELLAVLTELRRLVAARDPKLAERLQRRLPTPDRGGAVAMLILPEAARQERLSAWLGRDIVTAIGEDPQRGTAELLPRLGNALMHVEERPEQNGEPPWRWRQLPIMDNGQIVALSVGVPMERGQTEPDGQGRKPRSRGSRFAVEVSLSAIGTTRVEATYSDRRLDLVVESESLFEPESRAQIAKAVGDVLGEFGLSGSCRFAPYRKDPAVAVKV